jgi:hypothetical protein
MDEIEPLHTIIIKTIQTIAGLIVMEDHAGFPRNQSNLYCVSEKDSIVWFAEKPDPAGLFNRVMLSAGGMALSTYTITGHACDIDLMTGKLLNQVKML